MKIITVHSFKGGPGKSNIAANLSVSLADAGFKVGVVDSDIFQPSQHILFGLGEKQPFPTLSEFLLERCNSPDIIKDLSPRLNIRGKIYLVPANLDQEVIRALLMRSFDLGRLFRGVREIEKITDLDFMLVDARPGLDEKNMLFLAWTDILIIVLRNEEVDIRGTRVALDQCSYFPIRKKYLVLNMIDPKDDFKQIKEMVEKRFKDYEISVLGILPASQNLLIHAQNNEKIFIRKYPDDIFSKAISNLGQSIEREI